jgi:hypothetical protein
MTYNDLSRFHFLPEDQIEAARQHMLHQYLDSYWVVHPEKGLAFYGKGYGSPQCNRNESIARRFCPPWGEIKFIPRVLVPLNINDYKD